MNGECSECAHLTFGVQDYISLLLLYYHTIRRFSDQSTAVIENTDTENIRDFVIPYSSTMKTGTDANVHMTAANRFSLNEKSVEMVDAGHRIIPAPYRYVLGDNANTFAIHGIKLANDIILGNLSSGINSLMEKLGLSGEGGDHTVSFMMGSLPLDIAGPGSYTMQVTAQGTVITGESAVGLFHGFMSFIGLLDVTNSGRMTLKEMEVHDKPRFEYRGHQVDVARNFRSKEAIKKTIDAMALWKVSKMI